MEPHEHLGLHLKVRPGADGLHVEVTGDLDLSTADQLVHAITTELPQHDATLFLDLAGVDFCGSAGVSALLRVRRHQQDHGNRLRLARLTDHVRRVLSITGVLPSMSVLADHPTGRVTTYDRPGHPDRPQVVHGYFMARPAAHGAIVQTRVEAGRTQVKSAKAWAQIARAQADSARTRAEVARVGAGQAAQQAEQARTQAMQRRGSTVDQVELAGQLAKVARERAELAGRTLAAARRAMAALMPAERARPGELSASD